MYFHLFGFSFNGEEIGVNNCQNFKDNCQTLTIVKVQRQILTKKSPHFESNSLSLLSLEYKEKLPFCILETNVHHSNYLR